MPYYWIQIISCHCLLLYFYSWNAFNSCEWLSYISFNKRLHSEILWFLTQLSRFSSNVKTFILLIILQMAINANQYNSSFEAQKEDKTLFWVNIRWWYHSCCLPYSAILTSLNFFHKQRIDYSILLRDDIISFDKWMNTTWLFTLK